MGVDLFIAGLVVLFAIFGALTGAARQIAQLVALFAAYLCARPIGTYFGPRLATAIETPLVLGTILATILAFVVVLIAVRYVLTNVLRRIMAGREDPDDRRFDRGFGFFLGAAKLLLFVYVILSALTFVEKNVTVAGRRLSVTSRDSLAFGVARKWNLFELTQFSAVKDLARLTERASRTTDAAELAKDPAFQSLKKDPRFRRILEDESLRAAAERGDYATLLRSNAVLQLVQDPDTAARIRAAADAR